MPKFEKFFFDCDYIFILLKCTILFSIKNNSFLTFVVLKPDLKLQGCKELHENNVGY